MVMGIATVTSWGIATVTIRCLSQTSLHVIDGRTKLTQNSRVNSYSDNTVFDRNYGWSMAEYS